MAITRQDYQYIHNTLEKSSNINSNSRLKIGSQIENLLPEVKEENIWNSDFQDYYGSEKPNICWEPHLKSKRNYSKEVSGTGTPIKRPSANGSLITFYELTYNHTVSNKNDKNKIQDITAKNSVKSDLYSEDVKCIWNNDKENPAIICTFYSTNQWVTGTLSYTITEDYNESDNLTIKNGVLYTSTIVKPNTSYVLQVINSILPQGQTAGLRNTITLASENIQTSRDIKFDQYLFFTTGENENSIKLSINGLSYSYPIYGINSDNSIIELRCFSSNTKSKVFLFESDFPWMINNTGIITNISENYLQVPNIANNTGIKATLTASQLEKIFSEKPEITITSTKKFVINLPQSIQENGVWNWKKGTLWKFTGIQNSYPSFMDNVYLLVYRNFLTEEKRTYNDTKVYTQYGLLRTLQKTSTSSKDPYTKIESKIQLQQHHMFGLSPKSAITNNNGWNFDGIEFEVPILEKEITRSFNDTTETTTSNIDLYIASLLGYNYTYSVFNSKEDIYKYTSISFAWGKKEGNEFVRLSDFSKPIIIDRSILGTTISGDNTKYIFTPSNCIVAEEISTEYYPLPAVYIKTSE